MNIEIPTCVMEAIQDKRRLLHNLNRGSLMICVEISYWCERMFQWPERYGHYVGPEVKDPIYHHWNMLPDGSLLDASADQFGRPGIDIVSRDNAMAWYAEHLSRDHPFFQRGVSLPAYEARP